MAKYSKIGYGNYLDIDSAIAKGLLDGKDLVITKDTSELVYITNDKTKQVIQTRLKRFESEDAALAELISSPDTYAGQPVVIKNDTGCYQLYLVLTNDNGEFIVNPAFDASGTHVACDMKSLVTNDNGIMSIAGIEEAEVGSLLTKQADDSVEWKKIDIPDTSKLVTESELEAKDYATKGDLVKSSTENNKVSITEDGTMEINSFTFDKLVQNESDEFVIFGGNA